ncbi:hypothetical protein PoB_001929900 [Plakobranchus ocellatus]|uniref:Uncharacterized protein n=1 Tax=Plakobranchus ocellatus TaxID=259542 RepID=A0AAV3ZEI4_9GAST|nr:hypothetical protein PoB_001929900 [Plakobranchus ocellatus]
MTSQARWRSDSEFKLKKKKTFSLPRTPFSGQPFRDSCAPPQPFCFGGSAWERLRPPLGGKLRESPDAPIKGFRLDSRKRKESKHCSFPKPGRPPGVLFSPCLALRAAGATVVPATDWFSTKLLPRFVAPR